MMKQMIIKQKEAERSEEDALFLETHGTKIEFMDKNTIAPLVDYVKGLAYQE